MVRLKAKGDSQKNKWYFNTKAEAKEFMHVFEDHGCAIAWKMKEKDHFGGMDDYDEIEMRNDPKERAESELSWAFNSYLPDNPDSDISSTMASAIMCNIEV